MGLTVTAWAAGCQVAPRPVHDGPIVLITVDTLRADVVGAMRGIQGLTKHMDALASGSQWSQRAIALSSWTVPSMASIFSGLQPWAHGSIEGGRARLPEELRLLPEALREVGYRTTAFRSNTFLTAKNGYGQGFDGFYPLGRLKRAIATLRSLDGGRQFVWIHVLPPHAPYVKRESLIGILDGLRGPDGTRLSLPAVDFLPERVRPLDLEPWNDPRRPLEKADRERFWALYLLNVAYADGIVGQLLDAVRSSGQWDRTLLAVTSDHGEEFGENGQILHGGSLHRVLVEVPLLIKLPVGFRRLEPRDGVANSRLYATLLEATGALPTPGASPSLFVSSDEPVLSELYLRNGTNQFSMADGENQLIWTSQFAPSEPSYWDARMARMGGRPAEPLQEDPDRPLARLREAFERRPPLSGERSRPTIEHWRWLDGGGVERSANHLMADQLESTWLRSGPDVPPEQRFGAAEGSLSLEERERLRALGYLVDG